MSKGCYGSGGRKIRHRTLESAEAHRKDLELHRIVKYESYWCLGCSSYHVGTKRADSEALKALELIKTKDRWDEALVGKLIKAIKIAVGDKRPIRLDNAERAKQRVS